MLHNTFSIKANLISFAVYQFVLTHMFTKFWSLSCNIYFNVSNIYWKYVIFTQLWSFLGFSGYSFEAPTPAGLCSVSQWSWWKHLWVNFWISGLAEANLILSDASTSNMLCIEIIHTPPETMSKIQFFYWSLHLEKQLFSIFSFTINFLVTIKFYRIKFVRKTQILRIYGDQFKKSCFSPSIIVW